MNTATASPSVTTGDARTLGRSAPPWVGPAVFALAVSAVIAPKFVQLVQRWRVDPNYNHGFLVLPIAAYLGVRAFRQGAPAGSPHRRLGWMAIVIGGLAHLASLVFLRPYLDFLALFFLARGGLLLAGGHDWAAKFNFPLGFLLFLFPLPPRWVSYAALWLQDVAARVSETVLGLFVTCSRTGHTIRIAGMDGSLVVAEECSGTRQMIAFVALAALIGHLSGRSLGYKLSLLLSAVPVAIAANVLRVVLMNLGAYWFGTRWMGGWMHDIPALFSLPVGLMLFLAIDRTLGRLFPVAAPSAAAPDQPAPSPTALPAGFAARWWKPTAAVVLILAVGLGLSAHLTAAEANTFPHARGSFEQIPLAFEPSWAGQELDDVREQTRGKLPFQVDDLAYRGYQSADGVVAFVYLVHSRTGDDRLHHPEICMRDASGAPEDYRARTQVPLAAPDRKAQRFRFMVGGGRHTMVYYWNYTFPASTEPASPIQAYHQRVGLSAPSVTVQVTTAGDDPRAVRAVEQTLLPNLDDALRRLVLPENTAVGCDRTPIVLDRR